MGRAYDANWFLTRQQKETFGGGLQRKTNKLWKIEKFLSTSTSTAIARNHLRIIIWLIWAEHCDVIEHFNHHPRRFGAISITHHNFFDTFFSLHSSCEHKNIEEIFRPYLQGSRTRWNRRKEFTTAFVEREKCAERRRSPLALDCASLLRFHNPQSAIVNININTDLLCFNEFKCEHKLFGARMLIEVWWWDHFTSCSPTAFRGF